MQGPVKVGRIRMMLLDGAISPATMLLHAQLGMAPLQQALLIKDTPSMVPLALPSEPAGGFLPAVPQVCNST